MAKGTSQLELTQGDYESLAAFRHTLRRLVNFSTEAARAAGLTTQQHQALLAIKGQRRLKILRSSPDKASTARAGYLADLHRLARFSEWSMRRSTVIRVVEIASVADAISIEDCWVDI